MVVKKKGKAIFFCGSRADGAIRRCSTGSIKVIQVTQAFFERVIVCANSHETLTYGTVTYPCEFLHLSSKGCSYFLEMWRVSVTRDPAAGGTPEILMCWQPFFKTARASFFFGEGRKTQVHFLPIFFLEKKKRNVEKLANSFNQWCLLNIAIGGELVFRPPIMRDLLKFLMSKGLNTCKWMCLRVFAWIHL